MNILFLSRWLPFPPNNGSKIRIHYLLKGLALTHNVTLVSFSESPLPSIEDEQQYKIFSGVHLVPWKPYDGRTLKAGIGFLSPIPRSLVDTYSHEMASLIRSTITRQKIDLVIASQLTMASYYSVFGGVSALFEEIELGLFYQQERTGINRLKRLRDHLTWIKLHRYLSHLLKSFKSGTVVSEKEYQVIAEHFPKLQNKIEILPNFIDVSDYQEINVNRRPKHLIFSGSFTYKPNYQAMEWFLRHVFPLILSKVPDAQLIITGDHAGLPLPLTRNITLAGYVDDIRSLTASCEVSIAPLLTGGGTRLKILEAMAIGIPVVATTKGAEGLLINNGQNILIADNPEDFAELVIKLLHDSDYRDRIAATASRLVKEVYDYQIVIPKMLRLVEKAAAG
jgi:polysaccharide biosynthesis protein PslH